MKKMKICLSLLLALALCLSLAGSALAANVIVGGSGDDEAAALLLPPEEAEETGLQPVYACTGAFVGALEAAGCEYVLGGVDEDGDELVITAFDMEGVRVELRFYFSANGENAYIRVWNVINYDLANWQNVVQVIDGINGDYRFVRFYTDDYDNSVTAALDLIYRGSDVGEICMEALYYLVNIIEDAYPLLLPYAA